MSKKLLFLLGLCSRTADTLKVTVAGGSGFVGSRVCKYLVENGAEVTSVSQSGAPPAWAAGASWASQVEWKSSDLARGSLEAVTEALGTPEAFISCVGTIGFDRQGLLVGNGKANADCSKAAASLGVVRACYLSVSEELFDAKEWLPSFFLGYFDGKRQAESAFEALAPGNVCIVRPTFIYGGDEFAIAPPRVTADYGAFIESLLSAAPIKLLADVLPGLLKVALRPPVSVDAVAAACARQALGKIDAAQVIDGTEAINAAADLPEPVSEGVAA